MRDCLFEVKSTPEIIQSTNAIYASAITIINYIKAGELKVASKRMVAFRLTYPNRDIYLADGSSFIETVRMLFGEVSEHAAKHWSLTTTSTLTN